MNTMLRKFHWHRLKYIYISFKCTLYKRKQRCSFQVGCLLLSSLIEMRIDKGFLGILIDTILLLLQI